MNAKPLRGVELIYPKEVCTIFGKTEPPSPELLKELDSLYDVSEEYLGKRAEFIDEIWSYLNTEPVFYVPVKRRSGMKQIWEKVTAYVVNVLKGLRESEALS